MILSNLRLSQIGLALLALCAATYPAASRPLFHAGLEAATRAALVSVADKNAAAPKFRVGALVIEAPWARATPAGAQVAGGYVKITNTGTAPDSLVGGTFPLASAVEVHEMAMQNNVMKMRRLGDGLEIKPGATVELKPGSYHLMFTGLRGGLKAGQTIKGTLVFQKAGTAEVEYTVAPLGAQSGGPAKAGGGHRQH